MCMLPKYVFVFSGVDNHNWEGCFLPLSSFMHKNFIGTTHFTSLVTGLALCTKRMVSAVVLQLVASINHCVAWYVQWFYNNVVVSFISQIFQ